MFYAVEDVWPVTPSSFSVGFTLNVVAKCLFSSCAVKLSDLLFGCSPVTHVTYSSELPYFASLKPVLLQLAIKAKWFFLLSISSTWIKIYFIKAIHLYTLMLKAAFRSCNKSIETFVMGTLLDSLIGGGQFGGIKGMSPHSSYSPFFPLQSLVPG